LSTGNRIALFPLTFQLCHDIDRLVGGAVEATLNKFGRLFMQDVEIEARCSRLPQKKSMQEGYGDIAIGTRFSHYVFARVLFDASCLRVLSQRRTQLEGACKCRGGQSQFDDGAVRIHGSVLIDYFSSVAVHSAQQANATCAATKCNGA